MGYQITGKMSRGFRVKDEYGVWALEKPEAREPQQGSTRNCGERSSPVALTIPSGPTLPIATS